MLHRLLFDYKHKKNSLPYTLKLKISMEQHSKIDSFSIFDVAKTYHFIGRFVGLSCFSYLKSNKKHIYLSTFDIMLILFQLALHLYSTLLNIQYKMEFVDNAADIFNFGFQFLIIGIEIFCIFTILIGFSCRKLMWNIYIAIDEIDHEVIIYCILLLFILKNFNIQMYFNVQINLN